MPLTLTMGGVAALLILVSVIIQFATPDNSKTAMWFALVGGLFLAGAGWLGQTITSVLGGAVRLANSLAGWMFGAGAVGGMLVFAGMAFWFYHRTHSKASGIQAGKRTKSKHLSRGMQVAALCTCIALGTATVTTFTWIHELLGNATAQAATFLHQ